jgi:hypothetical protein
MSIIHYYAALYASRSVPLYVKECRAIVACMLGNPAFPAPTPDLSLLADHLDALDAAEQATHGGPKGAAAARDDKLLVVRADMRLLKGFVQRMADAAPASSKTIIESAGMRAVRKNARTKADLAAKHGPVPGTVSLRAKAARGRASYQWQVSTDQEAWTDLPATVVASTLVTGLAPATVYWFRVRVLTVGGISDWRTAVRIIAH